MHVLNTALWLSTAASLALAHPGHMGVPKLMGRRGLVDINELADRSTLLKRETSPDGTCGASNSGYTCGTDVNKCCSQYGWCGDTDAHCGTGCQSAYGICNATTTPDDTGRCGTQGNGASCSSDECCSAEGYCGTTEEYCYAPYCQVGYGGGCDADKIPAGTNTSTVARTKLGSVPYGADIYDCSVAGDIALTFDDGPDQYTDYMLGVLANYSAKATFFITGINNAKGEIDTTAAWVTVIQKMYAAGHQLASHTWSHPDLSTLSEWARRDEMYKLEMAMRNIVGFFPTYMRPPYSSCNSDCLATMAALGYHVTYFDVDTADYLNDDPSLIQNAKNNFYNAINPSDPSTDSFLTIAHDIHQQTAYNLTAYMLQTLQAKGYRAVTVGECLGDPEANWYRSDSGSAQPTATTTTATATTSTAVPTACATQVATWCPTTLPGYTTIDGCWTATGDCWDAGDVCWSTVPAADQTSCEEYQAICQQIEDHCTACVEAVGDGEGACAQLVVSI